MRTSLAILALVSVCAMASMASANSAAFAIDPSSWFTTPATPTGALTTGTDDLTRVRAYDSTGANVANYNTFSDATSLSNLNNWTSTIGAGEGISNFSLWLTPSFGYTTSYNQTLGISASLAAVQAEFAPAGWTATAAMHYGYPILSFSTTDPTKYIRPGFSPGNFYFQADVGEYNNATLTGPVVMGKAYRVFLWDDSDDETLADQTPPMSTGWTLDANSSFPGVNNPNQGGTDGSEIDFRAWRSLTAMDAVPEPITMTLVGMGIFGLGGYIRRRVKVAK